MGVAWDTGSGRDMAKNVELGLDDSTPASRWARESVRQVVIGDARPGRHVLKRLPSYEGYAGMCECGAEPEERSFGSFSGLTAWMFAHLDVEWPVLDQDLVRRIAAREVDCFGEVVGFRRLVETTEEHGTVLKGWLVAGTAGFLEIQAYDEEGYRYPARGRWQAFDAPTGMETLATEPS